MTSYSIEIPEDFQTISPEEARTLATAIEEFSRSLDPIKQRLTTIFEASGVPQYYYSEEVRARGIAPVAQGQEWALRPYPGYGKDDSVTLGGKSYTSTMPYNIFEPGKDGGVAWVVISGSGNQWRSGVSYNMDDMVTHLNRLWKCLAPHNSAADGPSEEQSATWQDMGPA